MKITKRIVLILLIFGFFLLFNSGLKLSDWVTTIQTLVFTVITILLMFQPYMKKFLIVLSLLLFILMVIFFTLDFIAVSNFFGSMGFGILIISSLFYLPKLMKYGHI